MAQQNKMPFSTRMIPRRLTHKSTGSGEDLGRSELLLRVQKLKRERQALHCSCPLALLVDDNDFNLLSLERLLGLFEITTTAVLDGDSCLRRALQRCESSECRAFELIFLDCEMPGRDGYDTARSLCQIMLEGLCRTCPIIATTGHSAEEVRTLCLNSGMCDFISKPIFQTDLQNLLLKWLK
eukprot:TRINITY_DN12851_c0_g1_i1.p1 TRINITY_DN12851_c0_g1~~TRINITY_DN12851_c0_g1_i1.p1  ORF type:complete len:182 (+),score=12.47 TRINITY_DN12851_c0_g1_i1:214-759(+)